MSSPSIYDQCGKLLHNLDALKAFQQGKTWPPHVVFHVTAACQLDCAFCCYKNRDKGKRIRWELVEKMLPILAKHGTKAIEHSGGEPTLYPRMRDMAMMVRDLGMKQGFITNGLNLSRVFAAEDLRAFTWIRVSLNSWEEGKPVPPLDVPESVYLSGSYIWHEGSTHATFLKAVEWCEHQGCRLRVVPDEWLPKHGAVIEDCRRTCDAVGEIAYLVHRLDRQPPRGCYLPWFKPMVGWDEWVYACCYGTTHEWDHNIQPEYRICHLGDLERFFTTEPIRDLGHRCSNCLGWEMNNLMAIVRRPVQHSEFF